MIHDQVSHFTPSIYAGFLCGRCPEGKGVDLTLRQCKECTVGDAVGVAIVCTFIGSLHCKPSYGEINWIIPYRCGILCGITACAVLQHWNPQ